MQFGPVNQPENTGTGWDAEPERTEKETGEADLSSLESLGLLEVKEMVSKVVSYGQQLRYERELEGWTQEELAKGVGLPVSEIRGWETEGPAPNLGSRRKLSRILGNDFYLSSEVSTDNRVLRARIVQRLLTAQNFTVIVSALTELHTKFRLIQQGHFADLIEYIQTHDSHFVEEVNLVITDLASNSPALITLFTDPHVTTAAVTSTVTLALALQKTITVVAQVMIKFKSTQRDLQAKEREKRRKQLEIAIQTTRELVNDLYPNIDPGTKATIVQAMLPNIYELLTGKGLKLTLPTI